jgi:hypothetical protein
MSPKAVSQTLVDILSRSLQLPADLMHSLFPGENTEQKPQSQ